MTAIYRICDSAEFRISALRRLNGWRNWPLLFVRVYMTGMWVTLAVVAYGQGMYLLGSVGMVGALAWFIYFSGWMFHRNIRRRFQELPNGKELLTIALSKDGVQVSGDFTNLTWSWKGIAQTVRCRDGILVWEGLGPFYWLPDDALVEGKLADVEKLVSEYAANYTCWK